MKFKFIALLADKKGTAECRTVQKYNFELGLSTRDRKNSSYEATQRLPKNIATPWLSFNHWAKCDMAARAGDFH
jgi:hypothetical protein